MLRIPILSLGVTFLLLTAVSPARSDEICDSGGDGFCDFGLCDNGEETGFCRQLTFPDRCDCVLHSSVPSVSQWGAITLMLSLTGLSVLVVQRRYRRREPSQ